MDTALALAMSIEDEPRERGIARFWMLAAKLKSCVEKDSKCEALAMPFTIGDGFSER
jgi:hypothetical protein